jgi:putative DNA primase/helicase
MTPALDSVTVLRARGPRLAKRVHSDGTITAYNKARTFDLFERAVANLEELERLLRQLERRPNCGIVRGQPADPERTQGVRRRFHPDH